MIIDDTIYMERDNEYDVLNYLDDISSQTYEYLEKYLKRYYEVIDHKGLGKFIKEDVESWDSDDMIRKKLILNSL